ncbi:MAG: hypothetical protein ACNA8S_10435 [Deferrisomatales bacterium]
MVTGSRRIATAAVLLALMPLWLGACSRYEQRAVPILHPSAYPNAVQAFGVTVGSRPYADRTTAREAFGFDIIGAGVLPVQVAFDHLGPDPIEVVPSQTFLLDPQGQLWNILDQGMAYNRLEKSSEWGQIAPEGAKGAFLGAAAGAIVGAAIGIVTGGRVLETTGKGAAVGGAGGAVLGGARGMQDHEDVRRTIREDLRNRSLENRPIPPQAISHGILYFPAEALEAKQLRLQLRNAATGEVTTLQMTF